MYLDDATISIFLPLYTTTMVWKLNYQDIIDVQSFNFNLRGFTKIWHLLF